MADPTLPAVPSVYVRHDAGRWRVRVRAAPEHLGRISRQFDNSPDAEAYADQLASRFGLHRADSREAAPCRR